MLVTNTFEINFELCQRVTKKTFLFGNIIGSQEVAKAVQKGPKYSSVSPNGSQWLLHNCSAVSKPGNKNRSNVFKQFYALLWEGGGRLHFSGIKVGEWDCCGVW